MTNMGDQLQYLFYLIPYIIMIESFLSAIATLFNALTWLASYILQNMKLCTTGSLGSPHNAIHSPSHQFTIHQYSYSDHDVYCST